VAAQDRYTKGTRGLPETLVSASEDNTLFVWDPENTKKPVTRMTGHQKPVIFATCSPDGRLVASASFDKSAKVWETRTGK